MGATNKSPKTANVCAPGMNPNGFTTDRKVDGERRSIRRYNDGRISSREANTKCHLTGIISTPKDTSTPKEEEYQAQNFFEVAELLAAIEKVPNPESSVKPQKYVFKEKKSRCLSTVSDDGQTTPPSIESPTPASSPELMSNEVFHPPVAPRVTTENPNSISNQWRRMGVNNVYNELGFN
ncbi:uncharacterized protein N7529_007796 [Penicillium soppii]|uniref:uncharacterized protein n=1 Tax=Penicillium soppii TaxID=69789 RepID=UPI002549268E|nr:uncharacterized protein N7529_007796 [Penicillium soppii]KAJ5860486.1 hypothetical protein N7529_007796 [Penicillium soppii]